jgi:5'-nucleotidase
MPYSLDDKLVVGVSSRALFDLDEADAVFRSRGLAAYRVYQREHEDEPLGPGAAFALVRALLSINAQQPEPLVEVIVMSRNDADSAMRVFNSIESSGLDITRGAFRGGRDPWACLKAFQCSLFLSPEPEDVFGALAQGFPAALVLELPDAPTTDDPGEVRIAFDGDAVLFDDKSERVFQRGGLEAFQEHEARNADVPLSPGPFRPFLQALARVQARFPEGRSPIRTSLVTARGAPAHRRVVRTLRAWNVPIDETYFLGGLDKTGVLEVLRPHIFFDDQMRHLERAASVVPSARVLQAVHQLDLFPPDRSRRPAPVATHPPADRAEDGSKPTPAVARRIGAGAGPPAAVGRPPDVPARESGATTPATESGARPGRSRSA